MPKKTFIKAQIVAALRLAESGTSIADLCRKYAVTEQVFYLWKKKYAGVGAAELRRLKQLVADLTLDKHILQEVNTKKI